MHQRNHLGDQSAAERRGGAESLPLLITKLYRPPVTPDLEPRTRLIERLERNRHLPLTVISAPAGYGKTMLASMWLEACDCPSAWFSLDKADNDLRSFSSYLLAALQTAFPTLSIPVLQEYLPGRFYTPGAANGAIVYVGCRVIRVWVVG